VVVGTVKARNIAWAGRDHLIITASTTSTIKNARAIRGEYYTVVDLDLRDRKLYPLLNGAKDGINIINSAPMPRMVNGKLVLLIPSWAWVHGEPFAHHALFKGDLDAHNAALAWAADGNNLDYTIDASGQVVATTEFDARQEVWALKVRQGDAWREVKTLKVKEDFPALQGAGRTPGTVLVFENTPDGRAYREVSTADATWTEPFLRLGQGGGPRYGADHLMTGTIELAGDELRFGFLTAAGEKRWAAIRAAFPGQNVLPVSESDDPTKLVVLADSPTDGAAYAYVDLATHKAEWLGSVYGGLGPEDIGEVRPLRFKATDGLDLTGYLTLPHGLPARGLPLVVMPHTGPDERDGPGFDWISQAIASRGYAVLQVNYRGSFGLGRAFQEAGYGQLGKGMQSDLSDGVRYLAAQGLIDPKRVCIAGMGYGGYSALAGAAFEPQVYRCAASIGGQSDWRRDLEWRSPGGRKFFYKYAGVDNYTAGRLRDISPAIHPEGITGPILLIHGKDDTRTAVEQSQVMEAALRQRGKPVQLELLDGEDHWLSRSGTRLKALQLLVTFLEKNNPPN
jgi:dipeptidyl aminopeptidase/acylaminoacyl peptidase